MSSESEDIDLFDDSDIGPNTMNLLAELHAVQGINSDTGSVSIIPPTPKKHRGNSDTSALRRLAFAAVDGPTSVCRSAPTVNGSTSTPSVTRLVKQLVAVENIFWKFCLKLRKLIASLPSMERG